MAELLIRYGSFGSVLLPILAGIFRYRQLSSFTLMVFYLVVLSLASDGLSVLGAVLFRNNYPVIHLYTLAETLLIAMIYQTLLKSKAPHFYGLGLCLLYLADLMINGLLQMNPLITAFLSLSFIALAILFFYHMFQHYDSIFFDSLPEFWINIGVLTYFAGALFSWLLFEKIHSPDFALSWSFHNMANILKNILFAIGLWKVRSAH